MTPSCTLPGECLEKKKFLVYKQLSHFLLGSSNCLKKWCDNLCSPISLCISRTKDQEKRIHTVIWRPGCCTGLCSHYHQMLRKDNNASSQIAVISSSPSSRSRSTTRGSSAAPESSSSIRMSSTTSGGSRCYSQSSAAAAIPDPAASFCGPSPPLSAPPLTPADAASMHALLRQRTDFHNTHSQTVCTDSLHLLSDQVSPARYS